MGKLAAFFCGITIVCTFLQLSNFRNKTARKLFLASIILAAISIAL